MKIVSKLTLFLLNPENRERSPLTTANQVFYKTKNTAVKRLFFIKGKSKDYWVSVRKIAYKMVHIVNVKSN